MNTSFFIDLATFALPSGFLSGTVAWIASRRKRRNDLLAEMQRSIELLCEKYNDVLQENVSLRREKADWLVAQQELLLKIDRLTHRVETLRRQIDRRTKKQSHETVLTNRPLRSATGPAVDNGLHRNPHDTDFRPEYTASDPENRRKNTKRQPRPADRPTAPASRHDDRAEGSRDRTAAGRPNPARNPA